MTMIKRSRYCSDRMCGATDCSTCYGPGYDREDDDDGNEDGFEEGGEDVEEDEDEPEKDPGPDFDDVSP